MKKAILLTQLALFGSTTIFAQENQLENITGYNLLESFTSITVDTLNDKVWAGTNKRGIYSNGTKGISSNFSKSGAGSTIENYVVQSMVSDKWGNIWIGHSGLGNTSASSGGILEIFSEFESVRKSFSANSDFKGFGFVERDGFPTRNIKCLTTNYRGDVWAAHRYHDLTVSPDYFLSPGAVSYIPYGELKFRTIGGYKDRNFFPEWPYPAYTYNPKPSETPQSRTCNSISSDSNEVWVGVYGYTDVNLNFNPAQIRRFDANNYSYKGKITFDDMGVPAGGVIWGIYLSPTGTKWVTFSAGKGFAVLKNNNWTYMTTSKISCILPAGTTFNENAIWGNKFGNVFFGTNNGLLVYDGRGNVSESSSYKLYNRDFNEYIPSNNITAGASERDSIQWVATDKGIFRAKIGLFDPTIDELAYKKCNNPVINFIEDNLNKPNIQNDKSYHIYKVETEICSQDGPNGQYCTTENIFKMMKDNIKFAAVTPYDFPYDGVSIPTIGALKPSDLIEIQNTINAIKFPESSVNDDEFESIIKLMYQVIPKRIYDNVLFEFNQVFSINPLAEHYVSRDQIYAVQNSINPDDQVQCGAYKLYNSSNFWIDRMNSNLVCNNGPRPVNPQYDPIFSVRDEKNYTITNYTAEGHILYPGRITRQVVEECGKIKIITTGVGTQFCGNNVMGFINGNANTVLGTLLFKNVDFRLIRAFRNLK